MYFTEVEYAGKVRYVPRSVQVDLEASVCNKVRSVVVEDDCVSNPNRHLDQEWSTGLTVQT